MSPNTRLEKRRSSLLQGRQAKVTFGDSNYFLRSRRSSLASPEILKQLHAQDAKHLSLEDMPLEVKLLIFSYLSQDDLFTLLPQVCTSWQTLSKDPSLWKRVSFVLPVNFDARRSNNREYQILKTSKFLKVLTLTGQGRIFPKTFINYSKYYPFLKEIVIKDFRVTTTNQFRPLALNCHNLESFSLDGCRFRGDLRNLVDHIADLPRLKEFACLRPIFSRPNNAGIDILADRCKGTLKVLKLEGLFLNDQEISPLASCTCLEVLHISLASLLSDVSLSSIGHLKLKALKLNAPFALQNEQWSDNEVSTFFSKSERCYLESLEIGACRIDHNALLKIAMKCPNLQRLAFRFCPLITLDGVLAILKNCPKITALDLSGCNQLRVDDVLSLPTISPQLHVLEFSFIPDMKMRHDANVNILLPDFRLEHDNLRFVYLKTK